MIPECGEGVLLNTGDVGDMISRQMELEIVGIIFGTGGFNPVPIAVHRRPYEVHIAANECRKTP